jgi:predicted nucleic acid-binding protein
MPALTKITALAEAKSPWAIPWPCIHEFLAIVTHPRIYSPPTPLATAINQIAAWLAEFGSLGGD